MMRGESLASPPLIMLHGGPGWSETSLFRHFNAPLEKDFVVVYWDQRGAGKSFDPAAPRSSLTVERFIADLDELVDSVCRRVGADKVAIFGHSWGSALGVLYAARFPEKVAAYVGSGQIGDWAAGESASYSFALAEAERRGDRKVLKALRAIGPPPHTAKSLWAERMSLSRLEGRLDARLLWDLGRMALERSESSLFELPQAFRAFRLSLDAMWPEVSRLNLVETAPALRMPVFFFLGRKDHWVPPEVSMAYFDALTAPSKRLVWFEESGHEPFVDEPAKFNAAMAELVRPALTTHAPARTALDGDDLLPAARAEVTHHVDIEAPPAKVWPWLLQMGRGRGGWYSWDLLDNGGVASADRIMPGLQKLAVGDILPVTPGSPEGFAVLLLDPPRALVLGDPSLLPGRPRPLPGTPRATWAFSLEPIGEAATRLVVRVRAEYEPSLRTALLRPLVGGVHELMERKQLRTIKQRAEAG